MNCQTCKTPTGMPYYCPYCGGQYCSQHRLPENHTCPQLSRAHIQRQNTVKEAMTQTNSGSYNYSFNFNPQPTKKRKSWVFSPKEVKHLGIAALLIIGIGFSIGFFSSIGSMRWPIGMMAVFSVCIMASFLVHELAHKITAQKCGLWAEFRLTMWGAVLTFASVFLPLKFIAPGAMMIGGTVDKRNMLKISIAGPITNILFASVFFILSAVVQSVSGYSVVLSFVGYINAFMAVFNLFPFGVFDGLKIFRVNKKIWAVAFITSLALLIYGYIFVFV
jgi:Zn-dependent protease